MKKVNGVSLTLVFVVILTVCFSQSMFAADPSSELLYIGAPNFFGAMDAAGFSDCIYWGQSSIHPHGYHELLSGEWGAAVYYDGITNNDKAMWLTDEFLYPFWLTNSDFTIDTFNASEDDTNNPVPANNYSGSATYIANDTAQSIIENDKVQITIDYEVVDLGLTERSPLAYYNQGGMKSLYMPSDRYVFLQTYSITNKDLNEQTITNLEFYQMLHGHAADYDTAVVNSTYETFAHPDPLENYTPYNSVHTVGNFRYDITQWNNTPVSHQDWVGFSSAVEPDWIENYIYKGGHNYDANNKPSVGTHINIENRTLNGVTEIYNEEVAGAMGWSLGSLDFDETTYITIAFMFGSGEPIENSLILTKDDNIDPNETCGIDPTDPDNDEITYTIYYANPLENEDDPNYLGTVSNVVITDDLPDYVDPFNVTVSGGGTFDMYTNTVTWDIGTLEPGDSDTVTITVEIYDAEPGGEVVNEAILTSDIGWVKAIKTTPVCCFGQRDVIYVDVGKADGGNGLSWGAAYNDLSDALTRAGGDCGVSEVWVAGGVYSPPDDVTKSFEIPDGVSVYGGFPAGGDTFANRDPNQYKTILTGNDVNRKVVTMGNNSLLDGFIVSDAYEYGIYGDDVDFIISNCSVIDNLRYGIYSEFGDASVKWCVIRNNGFDGIYSSETDEVLRVENCRIYKNSQHGINCYKSTATILNSEIHHNGDDSEDYYGINLTSPSGNPVIRNCTVVYNSNEGINFSGDNTPEVSNSIIWNNNGGGENAQLAGTMDTYYNCINGYGADPDNNPTLPDDDDNIGADPDFAYSNHTLSNFHLSYESPCIDVGNNAIVDPNGLGEYDIDKRDRIYNYGTVDMGADEVDCDDISNEVDWNADGVVNYLDYSGFARAWLRDTNDPNRIKYDLVEDNVIDPNDLAAFCDEWLWEACWRGGGGVYEMMMAGGAEGMMMALPEQIQQETPETPESTLDLEATLSWLEEISSDPEVEEAVGAKQLKTFIKSVMETLYGNKP